MQKPVVEIGCGSLKKGQCELNTEKQGNNAALLVLLSLSCAHTTPGDFLLNAGSGLASLKWSLRAEALPERRPK